MVPGRSTVEPQADRFFQVSLLGMLASGYLAVLGSGALDWPSACCAGAALLVRGLNLAGWIRLEIAPRWVNVATLAYILFFPIDYYWISRTLVASTVHLVLFVAVVKLLTASAGRDFLLLGVIAFLEVLAAAVLSANLSFFVFLTAFLISTVATLASGEIRHSSRGRRRAPRGSVGLSRRLGWLTGLVTFGILIITTGFFFVLPRTARAALERFAQPASRVTGFTTEVTLGQTGEIRRAARAVMHVRFDPEPPKGLLYWRGMALGEFNGWKWYNSYAPPRVMPVVDGLVKLVDDDQLRRKGPRMAYEVVLHTPPSSGLFVAGLPEHLRLNAPSVIEASGGALRLPFGERPNFRYIVYSFLSGPDARDHRDESRLPEDVRNYNLLLPPVDPRILALSKQLAGTGGDDLTRARAVERYLRTNLRYSLAPLEREVDDPLAHFLFERRQGHCEYFASAMAVLLRASWIPARVASGFLGGTYNPLSGWHVVRASDAHTWVEAWISGRGWVGFDPTPPNPEEAGPLWSRLAMWADAAEVFWQEWVIGYDLDRQMTLAFEVGRGSRNRLGWGRLEGMLAKLREGMTWAMPRPRAAGSWLLASALTGAVGLLFWRWRRRDVVRRAARGAVTANDAALLYERMLEALRRKGFRKSSSTTPLEFAQSLHAVHCFDAVLEFTHGYNELRYGGRTANTSRLAALLDTIEQAS